MLQTIFKEFYLINGKKIPKIYGSKGSKGCFAPSTRVLTTTGYKLIKDINIGELVASFNHTGDITYNKVIAIFRHLSEEVSKVELWNGTILFVTNNHWFLTEDNSFKELRHFHAEEAFVGVNNSKLPIKSITLDITSSEVYNLTVENNHTYIVEDIFVHNKGGSKGGGSSNPTEANDNLFATDLLYVLTAIGEGPVYRINSNGPQDIELNEGPIDDFINLTGDGSINTDLFYYAYNTGTLNQAPLRVFGTELVVPQSLNNPVVLRKGDRSGIQPVSVQYMATSTGTTWDALSFKFNLPTLAFMDNNGNTNPWNATVQVFVYDSTSTELLVEATRTISGKASGNYKFSVDIIIPEKKRSALGYRFTVQTSDNDPNTAKMLNSITFYGWDEIQYTERSYPRTSLVGYVVKATGEYSGRIPTITSMIKGLLCRVPSNYNQPILENGEIDWRQVEVTDALRASKGYYLQKTGSTVQTEMNPVIYDNLWDGSFVYNWTQNPVWVVFDLLTNKTYGLGINLENIDKYNFYKIAQYCDGVDPKTGKFVGVSATADGSWRYKPRNTYTNTREILLGLPNGTLVQERRFICDILLSNKKQVMDTIQQITALFRGILYYSAGKLSLNVDMPDELPMAVFNETNIIDGSLVISGTRESDIITGCEISFIDPLNHYKREIVRIDDDGILREVNHIENVKQLDLVGCTRRSQATRFGQYLLASGKYLRRKITFKSSVEAIHLTVGDIVSVATKVTGTNWGFAGRIFDDAIIGNSYLYLEHFTSPGLSNSIFTSNTKPLALRVIKQNSDRVDYYLLSNVDFNLINTGNVVSGYDVARVGAVTRYNPTSRIFDAGVHTWSANNVPLKNDLWTLGEVDPNNIFTSQSDKLFKVTQIQRGDDHDIDISAMEYISNVYVDSEASISYTPVVYQDVSSVLITPPAPTLDLISRPVRAADGTISYVVDLNSSTDTSGYPINIQTKFDISYPDTMIDIIGINEPYWHPEVLAYLDVVSSNGYSVSETRSLLLNDFIGSLKQNSLYNSIDEFWIHAGENEFQALLGFKSLVLGTAVNTPVFTANTGYRFDGSTTYVDSGWNVAVRASSMVYDNMHVGIYERTVNPTTSRYLMSSYSATTLNRIFLNPRRTTSLSQFILATGAGQSSATGGSGLFVVTKTGPTANAYQNGVTRTVSTPPSTFGTALPTGNVIFGGVITPPAALSLAKSGNTAFATIGAHMTAEQNNTYFEIVQSLLTNIGAAV